MIAIKWVGLALAVTLLWGCSGSKTENEATALDFFKRANTAFQAEDYRHAARLYRQAAAMDPRSAAIQYNLGLACYQAASFVEAAQAYRMALKLDPTLAEAHRNLALAEDRLYNLEAAQTHYNIYQSMMRGREAKKDDAAPGGAAATATPKAKPSLAQQAAAALPGQQNVPAPVSDLRRIGKDTKPKDAPAKSGGDGKWWTQDSSSRTQTP